MSAAASWPRTTSRRRSRATSGSPIPPPHDYDRISHPPSTFAHEKIKVEVRLPAAQRFIVEHGLNEFLAGERSDLGIIVQGGLTNVLLRGLDRLERSKARSRPWC